MDLNWTLFRFPFDDPDWKATMLLGALLGALGTFFPPALIPLYGMGVRVARQTLAGESPRLPRWDNWGELILDGLRVFAVLFVYLLPVIFIWMVMTGLFAAVPTFAAVRYEDDPQAIFNSMMVTVTLGMMLSGASMIVGLPLLYFGNVALTRAIALGNLSEAFNFREVWQDSRNGLGNYLIALAIWFGVYLVSTFAASLLYYTCVLACLYPFALGAALLYHAVVAGALYGQAHHHQRTQSAASPAAA